MDAIIGSPRRARIPQRGVPKHFGGRALRIVQ